jgi:DNA-binding CsgD family transcriptional regulator
MVLADDHRRWITANNAACELLDLAPEEVPWRTWDDFAPPGESSDLEERWRELMTVGALEGWYRLWAPERESLPVEFSATANVVPGRHLSVFIPGDAGSTELAEGTPPSERFWASALPEAPHSPLTEREREILTLVASGLQGDEMAERLFLSPETVKSHAHNAMGKLGVHTRAHAVAVALVTGQITWEDLPPSG